MEILKRLGLTGYEIAVYRTLLEHGKCAAKDIAKHSSVPPTAVYPNIRSLIEKGLAQQFVGTAGTATKFEAVPPDIALPSFAQRQAKQLQSVAQQAIPVLQELQGSGELFPQRQVVSLSYGSEASTEITKGFVASAKKSFYVLGWRFRPGKPWYIPTDFFRKLRRSKVDVRMIITGKGDKMKELIKAVQDAGIPLRYYPVDNFSVIVKDGAECKITLKNRTMDQKLNISIGDPDLSSFLGQYFLSIWEKAQPVDVLLK